MLWPQFPPLSREAVDEYKILGDRTKLIFKKIMSKLKMPVMNSRGHAYKTRVLAYAWKNGEHDRCRPLAHNI